MSQPVPVEPEIISPKSDIVFMDTETLGLDPAAPIWEFAAIRRNAATGQETSFHCFIDHDTSPWLEDMPEQFANDYRNRYLPTEAYTVYGAALMVDEATRGAHVIGAVPSFDTQRLAMLLGRRGRKPSWHYHLCDIENVIVGYLMARGKALLPPWDSNELSKAVGVDPAAFDRHTAMGDVTWVKAQWDAILASVIPCNGNFQ